MKASAVFRSVFASRSTAWPSARELLGLAGGHLRKVAGCLLGTCFACSACILCA